MPLIDLIRLFTLAAIWGGSFIFMRIIAPILGPIVTADLRIFLAGAVILIYFKIIGFDPELKKFGKHYLMIGILNAALPFLMFAFAALHIPAAYSAILNSTTPMFGAVFSALLLGEKLTSKKFLGFVFGAVGVMCVVHIKDHPVDNMFYPSIFACLIAAISYGLAAVYVKRFASTAKPMAIAGAAQLFASFALMPAVPFFPVVGQITLQVVLCLLALSLICSGAAFLIFYRLIANVGPTKALTVTFLIPVFGMLWSFIFLGENITLQMLFGCLLIIIGTGLVLNILKMPAPKDKPELSQ